MRTLTRIEELFLGILSFYLFLALPFAWWFFALLLAPDLSMMGYLVNARIGSITYNFVHHRGLSVLLFVLGGMLHLPAMQATALVLFGHSSMDRVLGYGLKYPDAFGHTHLGLIGRAVDQG